MSFNKVHRVKTIAKHGIGLSDSQIYTNMEMQSFKEDRYFNIDDLSQDSQFEFIRRFFHTNNIIIVTEKV